MFSDAELIIEVLSPSNLEVDGNKFYNILLIAQIVTLVLVIGLLLLYYRIIYGILLKRLNRNYKELETLDF